MVTLEFGNLAMEQAHQSSLQPSEPWEWGVMVMASLPHG
jgi:hypothetical protein